MEAVERISAASRKLKTACIALIWALPLLTALFWVGINYFPDFSRQALRDQLPVTVKGMLPIWALGLGYLITMAKMSLVIYGLVNLRRLFGLYEKGRIFESENVACLRSVGKAVIWWALAETICNAATGVVVTLHNPPGQVLLNIGVSSGQLLAAAGGFMVLTISWVMDEGRKMQAEQSLFV